MISGDRMPIDIQVGDTVRMRKPHPCGGTDWQIMRIGADIGMKCLTCGHRVMLTRRDFEKRLKSILTRANQSPASNIQPPPSDSSTVL
jgi:hypothetical protein